MTTDERMEPYDAIAALRQKLQENHMKLLADPDAVQAFKRLHGTRFNEEHGRCWEALSAHLNFRSYKRSLQNLKARTGKLGEESEAHLLQRYDHLIQQHKSFLSAAGAISQLFSGSGVDKSITHHKRELFGQFLDQPYGPELIGAFRDMGASDVDIAQYSSHLEGQGWDPLNIPGSDGTFSGAVKCAAAWLTTLNRERDAVRNHGLQVLEGAGTVEAVVIVAVAAIVVTTVTVCILAGIFGWFNCGISVLFTPDS